MSKRGFTLIELLIVISILSILVTFSIFTYANVQKSGRDAKRIADMKTIQTALQAYYTQYGQYPGSTTSYGEANCSGWDTSFTDGDSDGKPFIDPLVDTGILPVVPVDPQQKQGSNCAGNGPTPGPNYFYNRFNPGEYGCPGNKYYIVFGVGDMETSNGAHPQSPGFSCSGRDWAGTLEYAIGLYE